MKKYLPLILTLLFAPSMAFAISVPWNRPAVGVVNPLYTGDGIGVYASSTIGNGSASGGLTISGNATSTGIFNFASSTGAFSQAIVFANKPVSTTNFENATIGWTGNNFTIQTQPGGTGLNRAIVLNAVNNTGGTLSTLTLSPPNLTTPFFYTTGSNNGASQIFFSSSGNSASLGGFNGSSGNQTYFTVNPAWNQSSTAGFKALRILSNEWSTGSGVHYLQSWEASTTAVNGLQGTIIEGVFTNAGQFGLGSTSPFAKLAVHANNNDRATTLFAIGSSTASATTTLFGVTNTGHLIGSSTNPVLSSCGTGPSMVGDDAHGTVTVGGTGTGCTVTFGTPYTVAPVCTVTPQTGSVTNTFSYSVTNAAITATETGLGGNKFDYICHGLTGI